MASGVSRSMVLTLLGFCISVLFIVFVCSRLVCALIRRRRRSHRRRSSFPLNHLSPLAAANFLSIYVDRQGQQAGAVGLDPAAVAAFPTRAYSVGGASFDSSDAATQCVICLAEYEEKDILRVLPYCGHDFHGELPVRLKTSTQALEVRALHFSTMVEIKHLCLVKFKEGVVVDDTNLVSEMDMAKSFEWGKRRAEPGHADAAGLHSCLLPDLREL
ncbi:hypothetical protein GUJ93_ZPchr0009g1993 [Zizania palustris]|uniref:RING-type domain-containing protein n=1 Tax=Zizania palustris TaxID=103762 RepID=A0A8J5RL11_ZIZPA|nr:hypothetical protein GUJ93_ZPchr0009g1993 [Zizania palustris]